MGPVRDSPGQSPPSASRSLPFRNGSKAGSTNLRTLYRISARDVGDRRPEEPSYHSVSTILATSPNLPPTPPGANNETSPPAPEEATPSSDAAVFRSNLVTPINQNSPPTPDNTPPRERYGSLSRRPFLDQQPSIASTHAESFKTAHEDLTSEAESDRNTPRPDNGFRWPLSSVDKFGAAAHRLRHSSLPISPLVALYGVHPVVSQSPEPFLDRYHATASETRGVSGVYPQYQTSGSSGHAVLNSEEIRVHLDLPQVSVSESVEPPHPVRHSTGQHNLKRDKSLRERLLEAQSQDPSASTEKFADIIGWNNSVPIEDELSQDRQADVEDNRRFSGISTTSTVEASSLSAPTSRSTSRANSITSEHLHVRRQQAEKDLRKTLDRMESERLVHSLREWEHGDGMSHAERNVLGVPAGEGEAVSNPLGLVMPGTKEWAALRPPSIFDTPFSQPSFQSGSPEISEALAINYFPHNNYSVQLIEPFPVAESKAVQEVQKQNLPEIEVESPLRNPRQPPEPPQFKLIPPTPADEEVKKQLGTERTESLRRPGGSRRRSESLMSSISRNLSLKNARNRKADQDLDGSLHPFWRPRAFWDDTDSARPEPEPQERSLQRGIVNNSLGLPQERTVVNGPVSLVRRISERRKQKRGIVKQSSHSSLAKFQAGRKLHKLPGSALRFHFPLVGIKDIHEKLLHAKQRKEDEKRERRRADLRRSIGAYVISQGDSRFPVSNMSLSRKA
ncbi:hypothetical protein AYL99_00030 [Fonsecaea erecta]|uniref:Uncharacterized protein n=1 Tax=Fonsecaea erecta TaxID=1367422 RepID=A0A178ZW78_9EURO|nr:hypothetical protein AYL99_00030 [Fonsecaea erecta]OAP64058.1 hypothetical protein AYL99_00030 [Fonsecaea erecta]